MADLESIAPTPYRRTRVEFDVPEYVLVEESATITRTGGEVARPSQTGLSDPSNYQNVHYWPSLGCWTLAPAQQVISNIHEKSAGQPLILRKSAFKTAADDSSITPPPAKLAEVPVWRKSSDLTSVAYDTSVADTGDIFLQKRPEAGKSWAAGIKTNRPIPDEATAETDHDIVAESNDIFAANQGFFLRWTLPGTHSHYPGTPWSFYFGQYCLLFGGNGIAKLYEFCQDKNNNAVTRLRVSFRYAQASQICNTAQTMAIWPYTGPQGARFIAFTNSDLDAAAFASGAAKADVLQMAPTEAVYRITQVLRGDDQDMSPGYCTRPDVIAIGHRRDIRLKWQVSTLGWATSGTLIDLPAFLQDRLTGIADVTLRIEADQPGSTSITGQILDSYSRTDFTPGFGTFPYVQFSFEGDGTDTPRLHSYQLHKGAVVAPIDLGAFTATGAQDSNDGVMEVSITAQDADPSHSTANVRITDLTDRFPRLRNRGEFAAKIVTTYNNQDVVLHRGYAYRPKHKRRGQARNAGGFGQGAPRLYPSPNWHDYDVPMLGMWYRLQKRVQGAQFRYFVDDGTGQPWKVTDALRELIYSCGFAPSQVNIPDLPYRLWLGFGGKVTDNIVNPRTNLADTAVHLCKHYLGAYLIWDENANTGEGWWTLLFGTALNAPPIWNFVTAPASAYQPPQIPGQYPANTTLIFNEPEGYTVPPEYNVVVVQCPFALTGKNEPVMVTNMAFNFNSYAVPGSTVTLNPDHPDCLGSARVAYLLDYGLTGTTVEETQAAVNWATRRLFDFACHAQRIMNFTAPLPFYLDPNIGRYRPLRFQDPVTLNGAPYLMKAPSIHYNNGRFQMADFELIQPIAA